MTGQEVFVMVGLQYRYIICHCYDTQEIDTDLKEREYNEENKFEWCMDAKESCYR